MKMNRIKLDGMKLINNIIFQMMQKLNLPESKQLIYYCLNRTPLQVAVFNGTTDEHERCVKLLLENGCNVDAQDMVWNGIHLLLLLILFKKRNLIEFFFLFAILVRFYSASSGGRE